MKKTRAQPALSQRGSDKTAFPVLTAISSCHFLNDTMQSSLLAVSPLLKTQFDLSFAQIGLVTLTYQFTASLLQPLVGYYADRRPRPYSLAAGMGFTLVGLVCLSRASSFDVLLVAAALVGTGSSIFHPESSRVARLASGGASAWHNPSSSWAATPAASSAPCWPPGSYCRMGNAASPSSRPRHSWPWLCWPA